MKKLMFFMIAVLLMSGVAYAMNHETKTEQVNKAESAGNKSCPVSFEKIDEKTKVTYEYKGRIYDFCCPGCIDEFKKDPEKYIEEMKKTGEGKGPEAHKHHDHKH